MTNYFTMIIFIRLSKHKYQRICNKLSNKSNTNSVHLPGARLVQPLSISTPTTVELKFHPRAVQRAIDISNLPPFYKECQMMTTSYLTGRIVDKPGFWDQEVRSFFFCSKIPTGSCHHSQAFKLLIY